MWLFSRLTDEQLEVVAKHVDSEVYRPGSRLFMRSVDNKCLVLVDHGGLIVQRRKIAAQGTEQIVVGPNQVLGELGMVGVVDPRVLQVRMRTPRALPCATCATHDS